MDEVKELKGEVCPVCKQKTLNLMEAEREVPYFGKVFLFSMACETCKYHKADVETAEQHEPSKYTYEFMGEDGLSTRVVKSSQATVKIPHITTITPGPASSGYITNVEGILKRVQHEIEVVKESAEDEEDKKKAKSLLKKLQRVLWGQEKIKIIIEDPTGNSAIISDKAVKTKLGGG